MSTMVQAFGELRPEQQALAGGKGGALARLYQANYPVPEGFVILPIAFHGDTLTAEAWTQTRFLLAQMRKRDPEVAFAVRSSALSEDSAQASFAGEFETVLDVHSDEMVHEAIHAVRRSRHSTRVRAYTEAKGMGASHEIAVVVQQLVRADISGVLFTADPVSGSRNQMAGNYVYGLGDELVSGEVEPYTFTLERPRGRYDGPPELKRFARRLYRMANRLERDLGCAQDIEWCVAGSKLYLLQSRPITTLIEHDPVTQDWNSSYTGDYLWARQEPFPEVLTPSTWSLWGQTYLASRVEGIASLGNIGGRLYLNIALPYSLLRRFGKDHQESADIFTLMTGPLPQGLEIPLIPVSILGMLRDVAPVAVKMALKQRKLKANYEQIIAASPQRCQDLRKQIQETAQKRDLVDLWHEQVLPLFTDLSLLQDAYNEDYRTPYMSLRAGLTKLLGETEANALLSTLAGGSQQLSTIVPLIDLSKVARGEMSRQTYTTLYGHRHANENELAQARPYEDREWLDRQLAEFRVSNVDVQALIERRTAEFGTLWARFQERYPREAKRLRRKVSAFNEAMHKREAIRSEYTRAVGVARALFVRAGELLGLGDDVFMLTKDELIDALSGDDTTVAHIPARRERYETYRALPTYPGWIRGRFDPVQWATDPTRRQDIFDASATVPPASDGNMLRGYPGSSGRVEGLVRCIDSPDQGRQLQPGEILVAVTTNVGWTPLFPRAAAVVTDIGAPLAHAAIVARELGIPAVVGCGNATARLKTGDRVRVDGGRGIVEILETREA